MAFVLLHIAHDTGTFDMAVPDDEPVEALMPRVLAAAGLDPGSGLHWTLQSPGASALDGRTTLLGASVGAGATLLLVAEPSPAASLNGANLPPAPLHVPPPPPIGAVHSSELSAMPFQRTRDALPRRSSGAARIGLSVGAVLNPGRLERVSLANDLDSGPSPAALTRERRQGPIARARSNWAATNYIAALEDSIVGPRLIRCATIAVMSPKGGVGKTTVTTLLGMLLAQLRRDRIVAIDTNPDYGSLGRTLAPTHNVFVDDLLEVLDHPALTVTQLDTSLGRAQHGLLVLPAPTAPERMAKLDEEAYRRVIDRLQKMVAVIVLDCGTGLWEPAARAALAAADQIVLVSDAEPATASLVAEASQQLRLTNIPVTLVVNKMRGAGRLDVERFAHAIDWAQGLITMTDEPAAAASIATANFSWDRAPRSWRIAARELASVIAADWERLGLTL